MQRDELSSRAVIRNLLVIIAHPPEPLETVFSICSPLQNSNIPDTLYVYLSTYIYPLRFFSCIFSELIFAPWGTILPMGMIALG